MIKRGNKKTIALTQICLLVVGIFAISWMIGSSIGIVSAQEAKSRCTNQGSAIGCPVYYGCCADGTCKYQDCLTENQGIDENGDGKITFDEYDLNKDIQFRKAFLQTFVNDPSLPLPSEDEIYLNGDELNNLYREAQEVRDPGQQPATNTDLKSGESNTQGETTTEQEDDEQENSESNNQNSIPGESTTSNEKEKTSAADAAKKGGSYIMGAALSKVANEGVKKGWDTLTKDKQTKLIDGLAKDLEKGVSTDEIMSSLQNKGYSGAEADKILNEAMGKVPFPEEAAKLKGAGSGWLGKLFSSKESLATAEAGAATGQTVAAITAAVAWGAIAFSLGKWVIGPLFGASEHQSDAIGLSLGLGTSAAVVVSSTAIMGTSAVLTSAVAATGVGLAVAAIVFLFAYKKEAVDIVAFKCHSWLPKKGGADCEKCNYLDHDCTEYQCKSLGTTCGLINEGTEKPLCINTGANEKQPPTMNLMEGVLNPNHNYNPFDAANPVDKGVWVEGDGLDTKEVDGEIHKCIKPYENFAFGVNTNEPAMCAIGPSREPTIEEMESILDDYYDYNHSIPNMKMPSLDELREAGYPLGDQDDVFEWYVLCEDANGNLGQGHFVFKYCIDEIPDTSAPEILGTNLGEESYIASGQTSAEVILYTDKPATCKWDLLDRNYEQMQFTTTSLEEFAQYINGEFSYGHKVNLTEIQDNTANKYYFRCKNNVPSNKIDEEDKQANKESYEFTLIGTSPLIISSVNPNNKVITDSGSFAYVDLEVQTSGGANEGNAYCWYSDSCYLDAGEEVYTRFYYSVEERTHTHQQSLAANQGSYDCNIKCQDAGGNVVTKAINYTIETDNSAPMVVRAYYEDDYLKIITDEETTEDLGCVYSTEKTGCDYPYDDGLEMTKIGENKHYVEWETGKSYYIKCKDKFGNRLTSQNQCNIIVKPYEDYKQSYNE